MATLWNLRAGQHARITGFATTLNSDYLDRLVELGFHPGEVVACVQAPGLGAPRAYRVSNTVYALDKDVAGEVLVEFDPAHG